MSIKIHSTDGPRTKIFGVDFPGLPDVEREPLPVGYEDLQSQVRGFSYQSDPPTPSFKVYRALCDAGYKSKIDALMSRKIRSNVTTNYIYNGLLSFVGPSRPALTSDAFEEAVSFVASEFTGFKVPLLSLRAAARLIPQNTSPGLPWIITHPGKKKGEILETHLPAISGFWDRISTRQPTNVIPDCAAFARSHIGSPGRNKVRPVWAYPLTAVVAECSFGHNVLKLALEQKIAKKSGYGMEMMRGGMHWLNNKLQALHSPKFVMLDYTNFDSSIPAWLIRRAFAIVEGLIDFSSEEQIDGTIRDVDPVESKLRWKTLVNYFINTPVRLSDGTRIQTHRGIPSGSYFTNLVGTICNMIVTRYLCQIVFGCLPMFDVYFGDDGVLAMPFSSCIDLQTFARASTHFFGMQLNETKSYWTHRLMNVKFLGYFNYSGVPIKPNDDLLAAVLYPQKFNDSWDYCVSRALGCLLASAGASNIVFDCVQAIVRSAERHSGSVERGLKLIASSPRSRRFLDTLGLNPNIFNLSFFHHQYMSNPVLDCSKLALGV